MTLTILVLLGAACDEEPEASDDTMGETGAQDRPTTILELEGDVAAGGALFTTQECSTQACHGSDGIQGEAPDLNLRVPVLSDEEIVYVLLDGRGAMPPQSRLSDQQLADVIAWLNESFA